MNISLFSPDLAEALGWTILHSLWQGALIFVILIPVLALLNKQAPRLRYNLLCLALLLFTVTMVMTFFYGLPEEESSLTSSAKEYVSIHEQAPAATASGPAPEITRPEKKLQHTIAAFIRLYAGQLANIWLIGAFFFAFRWMGGALITYRLKRSQTRPLPTPWQHRVQHWSHKLGIHKSIRLLESAKAEVPMIIGHLRPVILLPLGTLSGLTPEQVEAVIVHELAHIRRHDFLINLLLSGLEAVLFYHPVFWWISNKIHQEREQCCDDIAVSVCGNPKLYARTLMIMEEKRQQNYLAMAYQGKKHHLLDRIKRICLAAPASYRPEFGKAGLSLSLLLIAAAVTWAKMPASPGIAEEVLPLQEMVIPEVEQPVKESPASPIQLTKAIIEPREPLSPNPEEKILPITRPAILPKGLIPGDTIPYVPNIPAMRTSPELPSPPEFPYKKESIKEDLNKSDQNRESLRQAIDQYKASLNDWKNKVEKEYLGVWNDRKTQIMTVYENWKADMKAQSKGDEITEAVALKKGIRYFEDALRENEEAIRKSENTIRADMEDYIRTFEEAIREKESGAKDRDERMAFHNDRMRVHNLRMDAHNSRMTIHNQRMSIHNTRMQFHNDRMEAHKILMEAFEKEFFAALEADGLSAKGAKELDFMAEPGKITVNGRTLNDQQAQKYFRILEKYGFEIPSDGHFVFKISGDSRRIGTTTGYSESSEKKE